MQGDLFEGKFLECPNCNQLSYVITRMHKVSLEQSRGLYSLLKLRVGFFNFFFSSGLEYAPSAQYLRCPRLVSASSPTLEEGIFCLDCRGNWECF